MRNFICCYNLVGRSRLAKLTYIWHTESVCQVPFGHNRSVHGSYPYQQNSVLPAAYFPA